MRYSQFSRRRNGRKRKLSMGYEDLRRGDFRASQGARSNPESVSFADQEKRRGRYRDRLHQRYRARPQKPAVARFRGAIGGGVRSTTGGSAVLRRTTPFGQENRRSFT